jgi:hypothetical protein
VKAKLIRLAQMLAPILIQKWRERQAAKRRTR